GAGGARGVWGDGQSPHDQGGLGGSSPRASRVWGGSSPRPAESGGDRPPGQQSLGGIAPPGQQSLGGSSPRGNIVLPANTVGWGYVAGEAAVVRLGAAARRAGSRCRARHLRP